MAEIADPAGTPAATMAERSLDSLPFQSDLKAAFDLYNASRHLEAEAACRSLMQQHPQDGQLLFLFGMVLQSTGRSQQAVEHLEAAAVLHPGSARIFDGLGFVHLHLKNPARAVACYGRAVELGLRSPSTFYSLGNACYQLGEVERAAALFLEATTLNPRDTASWNNLGKCLQDLNRLEESLAAYDQAVAIDPNYSLARYGRALSLLAAGRLPEGFREYNQWRRHGITPRQFPQPVWQGEAIPGRTLFLHAEQGFGDAIQYARFLPVARERAGTVILECRPELKTLFTHTGIADTVIAFGENIPPFDYWASQASLPGVLGVSLATIPRQVPYLKAPTAANRSVKSGGSLKVGVVWAGNPSHHNDAARSARLEDFLPLFQVPGVVFYSLQRPVPERDETGFRSLSGVVNVGRGLNDFLASASAVAEMDLVIAVDTAMAHLAGAMAKPVWTLLTLAPDWRWMMEREDTPWYPTMRLFRQTRRNDWRPVILRAAEALNRLAGRQV